MNFEAFLIYAIAGGSVGLLLNLWKRQRIGDENMTLKEVVTFPIGWIVGGLIVYIISYLLT